MSYNEMNFTRQLELQDQVLAFLVSEAGQKYIKEHYDNTDQSAVDIIDNVYKNWPML
jgi:hypothetical protein